MPILSILSSQFLHMLKIHLKHQSLGKTLTDLFSQYDSNALMTLVYISWLTLICATEIVCVGSVTDGWELRIPQIN